jgi:hypothetical protein
MLQDLLLCLIVVAVDVTSPISLTFALNAPMMAALIHVPTTWNLLLRCSVTLDIIAQ